MLAHRSIGVILLLLLTKVLELPGQNVAALVSAKRGGGGMARSTEGAHRRGRTSLNMRLDFLLRYSDNSTTLHGSAKLCSLFTHTAGHPGQLEHWVVKFKSKGKLYVLTAHCTYTHRNTHTHTHIHIPTYIHTYYKSNCICCIFYPIWESRLPAALIISSLKLKIKNTYMFWFSIVTFAQRHIHIHIHKLYVLTAHCTYTHRKTHTHTHTYTDIQTYIL